MDTTEDQITLFVNDKDEKNELADIDIDAQRTNIIFFHQIHGSLLAEVSHDEAK